MSNSDRGRIRWTTRLGVLGVGGALVAAGSTGSAAPTTDADPTAAAAYHLPHLAPAVAPVEPPLVPPLHAPASRTVHDGSSYGVVRAPIDRDLSAYPGGIADMPPAALAAYQRAASVIDSAVKCHLDWSVLAGIGRVESDHGTLDVAGGTHRVTAQGQVRPALFGAPLDGRSGRGRVPDTDAGRLDRQRRWDAPVGPMALLPQLWEQVAVDADGDGRRDPQDLDDATLGTAVALCGGGSDLRDARALDRELRSFDNAHGFARVVVAVASRYAEQYAAQPVAPATVVPSGPIVLPLPNGLPGARSGAQPGSGPAAGHTGQHTGHAGHAGSAEAGSTDQPGSKPAGPGHHQAGSHEAASDPSAVAGPDHGDTAAPPAKSSKPAPTQPPAVDECLAPDGTVIDITDPAAPVVVGKPTEAPSAAPSDGSTAGPTDGAPDGGSDTDGTTDGTAGGTTAGLQPCDPTVLSEVPDSGS